jgi:flavodoxin
MKALVIFDSQYGYTEKIAKAIAKGFTGDIRVKKVGEVTPEDIAWSKLVVIGSPTQGGRQTAAIKTFAAGLKADSFTGKRLAAFDTRMKGFVKMFGNAAQKIESSLKDKGGNFTAQPQGFWVKSSKGPLVEGEEERATIWAKAVAAGVPTSQMKGDFEQKQKE